MTVYILSLVVLVCLSAFFSASEMAFSSANRLRLENAMEDGKRAARMAVKVEDKYDDALSAILIGNNLVNIAASSISSVLALAIAPGGEWTWLATVIITVAIIIFGETMPKIVAKKNSNRFSMRFCSGFTTSGSAPGTSWSMNSTTVILVPRAS